MCGSIISSTQLKFTLMNMIVVLPTGLNACASRTKLRSFSGHSTIFFCPYIIIIIYTNVPCHLLHILMFYWWLDSVLNFHEEVILLFSNQSNIFNEYFYFANKFKWLWFRWFLDQPICTHEISRTIDVCKNCRRRIIIIITIV